MKHNIFIENGLGNISDIKAGDEVLIHGAIYTARDVAHKVLVETLKNGCPAPIDFRTSVIYYCGPTPSKRGEVVGACGPTTASRMDTYTPFLLKKGLKCMIGKGNRSFKVREAIRRSKALYLMTYGGCAAYLQQFIAKKSVIAYKELGPEAMYRLEVRNFPTIAAIDAQGNTIF